MPVPGRMHIGRKDIKLVEINMFVMVPFMSFISLKIDPPTIYGLAWAKKSAINACFCCLYFFCSSIYNSFVSYMHVCLFCIFEVKPMVYRPDMRHNFCIWSFLIVTWTELEYMYAYIVVPFWREIDPRWPWPYVTCVVPLDILMLHTQNSHSNGQFLVWVGFLNWDEQHKNEKLVTKRLT